MILAVARASIFWKVTGKFIGNKNKAELKKRQWHGICKRRISGYARRRSEHKRRCERRGRRNGGGGGGWKSRELRAIPRSYQKESCRFLFLNRVEPKSYERIASSAIELGA